MLDRYETVRRDTREARVIDVTTLVCGALVLMFLVGFICGRVSYERGHDPMLQANFPCQEDEWLGYQVGESERLVCVGRD